MATILEKIIATKRDEVALAKAKKPQDELQAALVDLPPCRDFLAALMGYPSIRLIAEVKKASPSKGVIRDDFDPVRLALDYQAGGAAALSVLTDEHYFQGSLEYLVAIKKAVEIPVLRKEFIIDEYQILEARVAGADAVLLIAECLSESQLAKLYHFARELGMHALIELYEPSNLDRVLETGCPLVGINNRDLHTFEVDLGHTLRLRKSIPEDRCVVGESGIFTAGDAKRLWEGGVQAILVGESLMRQPNVRVAVENLLAYE